MPNSFVPNGFSPQTMTGTIGSFDYTIKRISPANTEQIFFGDPVVQLTTGYIRQMAAGESAQFAGIFQGCEYASISQGRTVFSPYWPGADVRPESEIIARVITSPSYLFRAMTGPGTQTVPFSIADTDTNYSIGYGVGDGTAANGDISRGFSTAFIDLTTASPSTTTRSFRAIDFAPGVPGTLNGYDRTSPFNLITVAMNFSDARVLTGTSTAS